jgi:hypothetical protein
MRTAREVFSDNNFNLESRCVRCGKPVTRTEDGQEIVPVLAIGTLTESGALDEAATLCSSCVSAIGFQRCYQAAATRSDAPHDLHCIYQVVGSPREQDQIEQLIQLLDQSGAS